MGYGDFSATGDSSPAITRFSLQRVNEGLYPTRAIRTLLFRLGDGETDFRVDKVMELARRAGVTPKILTAGRKRVGYFDLKGVKGICRYARGVNDIKDYNEEEIPDILSDVVCSMQRGM